MKVSTIVTCVVGLAFVLTGVFLGVRIVSLEHELTRRDEETTQLKRDNLRLSKQVGRLQNPERTIADLEKKNSELALQLAGQAGTSFEDTMKKFLAAVENQRKVQGIDYEQETIARYIARTQIERLAGYGTEYYDEVEKWIDLRPEGEKPLHREHRRLLLGVLFQMDAERAFQRAQRLFEQEGADVQLRLVAAGLMKKHDAKRALKSILDVLDFQRGRPPHTFPNLANLVNILGEIGDIGDIESENREVHSMLRRIASEPTWEMAARNRALDWIGRLRIEAAWPELEAICRQLTTDHYIQVKSVQTMRALDLKRTLTFVTEILNDESRTLDPVLSQNYGKTAELIRQELDELEKEKGK